MLSVKIKQIKNSNNICLVLYGPRMQCRTASVATYMQTVWRIIECWMWRYSESTLSSISVVGKLSMEFCKTETEEKKEKNLLMQDVIRDEEDNISTISSLVCVADNYVGADSMGAMAEIAPRPKSCGGDAPKSSPQQFCYV